MLPQLVALAGIVMLALSVFTDLGHSKGFTIATGAVCLYVVIMFMAGVGRSRPRALPVDDFAEEEPIEEEPEPEPVRKPKKRRKKAKSKAH